MSNHIPYDGFGHDLQHLQSSSPPRRPHPSHHQNLDASNHRPSRLPIRTDLRQQNDGPSQPSNNMQQAIGGGIVAPDYGPAGGQRRAATPPSLTLPPPSAPPSYLPPRRPPQRPSLDISDSSQPMRPVESADTALPRYPFANPAPTSSNTQQSVPSHPYGNAPLSNSSVENLPWVHQAPAPSIPQHIAQVRTNQRAPLGPPPSSRRGPAHYYAPIAGVHPIEEETEIKRSSVPPSTSALPAGSEAGRKDSSVVASSAAPASSTVLGRRSQVASSIYPDDESFVGPGPGERKSSSVMPLQMPKAKEPKSPGGVTHMGLGKRARPTLTTVKSSDASNRDGRSSGKHTPEQSTVLGGKAVGYAAAAAAAAAAVGGQSSSTTRATGSLSGSEAFPTPSNGDSPRMEGRVAGDLRPPPLFVEVNGSPHLQSRSQSNSPVLTPRSAKDRAVAGPNSPQQPTFSGSQTSGSSTQSTRHPTRQKPMRINDRDILSASSAGTHDPDDPSNLATDHRGSLSSLTDLIKRATRLASNLDRGKTASRFGAMNWMDAAPHDRYQKPFNEHENQKRIGARSSLAAGVGAGASRFSDIIASFPSPRPGETPNTDDGEEKKKKKRWRRAQDYNPTPDGSPTYDGEDEKAAFSPNRQRRRDGSRRCCGLPLWLFLLLLILLILLIAAAIILPIALIVIPHQQVGSNNANDQTSATINSCKNPLACENGGANVAAANNGSCACLCVNGFTGSRCSVPGAVGCATVQLAAAGSGGGTVVVSGGGGGVGGGSSSMHNATVGDQIPGLLINSQTWFGIALDAGKILGAFSVADLSCASEDALVTFVDGAGRELVGREVFDSGFLKREDLEREDLEREDLERELRERDDSEREIRERELKARVWYHVDAEDVPALVERQQQVTSSSSLSTQQQTTSNSLSTTSTSATSPTSIVAATSNGIVFASGPTPSIASSPTSTSSDPTNSSNPNSNPSSTSTPASATTAAAVAAPTGSTAILTFARVAVLYILQSTSDLSVASSAQLNLQKYFSSTGNSTSSSSSSSTSGEGNNATATANITLAASAANVQSRETAAVDLARSWISIEEDQQNQQKRAPETTSSSSSTVLDLGAGWTCDLTRFTLSHSADGVSVGGNGTAVS